MAKTKKIKDPNKFPFDWTLKDAIFSKDKGKVFSCFAAGGGSTMGYKLAGFDVLGCNEIDPKMNEAYIANNKPKYSFLEPIQTFKNRDDLPKELYNIDILDGSPPCSSFSMSGNREKDWGKEKKFREGQAEQVLDDLFFDFIDLANKLQPKVIVAENVKGLLMGQAKKYVIRIYKAMDEAGYYCQHFLLNAKDMGVPQKRERVFFVCLRKDLAEPFLFQKDMFTFVPKIDFKFNEEEIPFGKVRTTGITENKLSPAILKCWKERVFGEPDFGYTMNRVWDRDNTFFSYNYIYDHKVCNTITGVNNNVPFSEARFFNDIENVRCGTFPSDYDFKRNKTDYVVGMSVPPVMMAQVATRIYEQWISKL